VEEVIRNRGFRKRSPPVGGRAVNIPAPATEKVSRAYTKDHPTRVVFGMLERMEEKIVGYLRSKYQPKAIVLIGSRAAGEETAYSDWDLVLYVEGGRSSELEIYDGQSLDLEFIKLPVAEDHILQTSFAPDSRMKVLFDTDNFAAQIVERTLKKIEQGPDKLSEEEVTKRKKRIYRLLQKCMARPDDEGYVFVYIGAVHEFCLRYCFELKQQWSLPVYKALAYLQENDPNMYELFKAIQGKTDPQEKVEAGKKLYEGLFNEKI